MPIVELTIDSSGALTGAKQYDQAAGQVTRSTQKAEGALTRMREGVNRLGPVIAAGGAAIGTAFVAIGKHTIDAASAMEETQNKFDVVFRGMTEEAEAWSDELVSAYQMTSQEAKSFLASTQDLLKPMGVAADQAGKMSNEVTKLAADLGSFNDQPTAQVMADIQSALVGNFETMKKYGVVVNAAAVEQEAYTSGLAKQGEELTAAHKAQAAFQLILAGTTDAQGDIARSSESWANQVKQLQANMGELAIMIGERILPVATQVLEKIVEWTSNQDNLNRVINGTVETLRFMYNAFKGIQAILKAVIVAIAKFAEYTFKAFKTIMTPLNVFAKAIEKLGGPQNPFDMAQMALEDFSASAVENLTKTWNEIENGNQYFDTLRTNTEAQTESQKVLNVELERSSEDMQNFNFELGRSSENMMDMSTAAIDTAGAFDSMANSAQQTTGISREMMAVLHSIAGSLNLLVLGQMEQTRSAQEATTATQRYMQTVSQLGTSAGRTANQVTALAGAQQAAAMSGAAAGGGGGYTTGMTGARSGRFNLPGWFSSEMISAYGRHASDVLTTGTPHLGGKFVPGYGNTAGGKRRDEARREWYQQQYDPTAFAAQYLREQGISDFQGNVRTSTGVTLNIYQEMSKDQIEALVAELERANARQ